MATASQLVFLYLLLPLLPVCSQQIRLKEILGLKVRLGLLPVLCPPVASLRTQWKPKSFQRPFVALLLPLAYQLPYSIHAGPPAVPPTYRVFSRAGHSVPIGPCAWKTLSSESHTLFANHCHLVGKLFFSCLCTFTTHPHLPQYFLHSFSWFFFLSKALSTPCLFVCSSPSTRANSQSGWDFEILSLLPSPLWAVPSTEDYWVKSYWVNA